ncbi:MAG: hypothetical protein QG608_3328, partial [Actinomycetota bacterium]|nr:hypothetical protein [Actinomycetota bacterium]
DRYLAEWISGGNRIDILRSCFRARNLMFHQKRWKLLLRDRRFVVTKPESVATIVLSCGHAGSA